MTSSPVSPTAAPHGLRRPSAPRMALATRLLTALVVALSWGGPAHATYPGENGPIVFESLAPLGQLAKVTPGSTAVQALTTGWSPRVSPNGRKVVFLRGPFQGKKNIFLMNIDGTQVVQLTNDESTRAVTWLPDGSRLAYVWLPPGGAAAQLRTMKLDGTGSSLVRTLGDAPGITEYAMDWAPASNAVVMSSSAGQIQVSPNAYGDPFSSIYTGLYVAWAPDEASILFTRGDGAASSLLEINPDGTHAKLVPPRYSTVWRNAISPDGLQIAGGWALLNQELTTRARSNGQPGAQWPVGAGNVDWGRVPKNCHATTPQGGGGVLGGDVDFYADQCAIAVMPNPAASGGVLAQALAVGPDSRVYARALKSNPLNGVPVWGPFTVIPGLSGNPDGVTVKKLAVSAARDGSLQVAIVMAGDNTVAHAIRYANGSWSGFSRLDGFQGAPSFQARDVAIAINGSTPGSQGNAQVIANGLVGGSIFHRVRWPAGNWSPFMQVPGAEAMNTQALAIASSDDLYTNVLTITTGGEIKQVLRDPAGNWGGWVNMATPQGMQFGNASDVAITRTDLGSGSSVAYVMFVDATRQAYLQVRNDPNLTASWQVQMPVEPVTTDARTVSLSWGGFQTPMVITRAYPQ